MSKIPPFFSRNKTRYLVGTLIIGIITLLSLIIGFSDVLVDKPEENAPLDSSVTEGEIKKIETIERIYFTLGSTKDEVLNVQGKPTNIVGNAWYYGASRVDFNGDTVIGYSDRKDMLKIEMKPKVPTDKKYFALGLTKDEVLSVQGKPSNIIGEYWYYGASKVEFVDGRVHNFSDRNLILNVKPRPTKDQ